LHPAGVRASVVRGRATAGPAADTGQSACADDASDALTKGKKSRRDHDLADDLAILDQPQPFAGLLER
jgi:hypothetical protein